MTKPKWILLAEDNAHDAALARRALASSEPRPEIVIVRDGVEALHCLHHQGKFHSAKGNPDVVLLDLKMPRVDGFEVLEEMKADVRLKHIPVVIFHVFVRGARRRPLLSARGERLRGKANGLSKIHRGVAGGHAVLDGDERTSAGSLDA